MAHLRLFGPVRVAVGRGEDEIPGSTVEAVIAAAAARYGESFAAVAGRCRVWVNGSPAGPATDLAESDEVALLPPVSGG